MREFNNVELKRSSWLLIANTIVFFIITAVCLNFFLNQIKSSYIEKMSEVASVVMEKAPEAKEDVLLVITGKTTVDGNAGRRELEAREMNELLGVNFFPGIDRIFRSGSITLGMIFLFAFLTVYLLNYYQYKRVFKKIRQVIDGARVIMDGNTSIHISEEREGEFSRLAVAFNSMGDVIRENIVKLEREKKFLADLLSDISHQLKTPLTSMMIYNDIMSQGGLSPEKQLEFLENNLKQLERMNFLIKSLLRLAKLDAGAIVLSLKEESLKKTASDAVASLTGKAQELSVALEFIGEDIIMKHDVMWLGEALMNLIKNGIEHTPAGGIVKVKLTEGSLFVKLRVEDNGSGIDEKDLPHIFKRFYKAKGNKSNDSVGIGLAISKSIIEQHRGLISVESELGVGTAFEILFFKL